MKRIFAALIFLGCMAFPIHAQTSGNTPPPPPVCSQSIAGQLYTNTGTSPATVYICSYYNLSWQWVVNPSYGGLVYYPVVPSTCTGALPAFLAGWPSTQMYICVSGFPQLVNSGGSWPGYPIAGLVASSGTAWRAPVYGDITKLWTTCTTGFMKGDGTCPSTAAIANGGTGATTAAGALTNLGGAALSGATFTGAISVNGSADTMISSTSTSVGLPTWQFFGPDAVADVILQVGGDGADGDFAGFGYDGGSCAFTETTLGEHLMEWCNGGAVKIPALAASSGLPVALSSGGRISRGQGYRQR